MAAAITFRAEFDHPQRPADHAFTDDGSNAE